MSRPAPITGFPRMTSTKVRTGRLPDGAWYAALSGFSAQGPTRKDALYALAATLEDAGESVARLAARATN